MSIVIPSLRAAVAVPGWAKNELWRKAIAVPSLDLRFAENKSLTDAKTGASLVDFTRASTGTFVGSDGLLQSATTNEARFDHNPTTGESLGLLVEEARTNLVLQSEDLSTSWTNTNTSETTNAATAPDGTTTADKLIEAATTTEHSIRQDSSSQAAGTYTFSIFAKAAERTFLQFAATGVLGSFRANFNISTGILGSSDPELIASIVSYGNGWYKCIVTRTTTATGTLRLQWNIVTSSSAARVESYAGDGTSGLFLWGAQLETGAFATSYIPTTTATATRAADVASITGTAFSSFYNQTEGTALWFGRIIAREVQVQVPFKITEGTALRGTGFQIDTRAASLSSAFITRAAASGFGSVTNPSATILSNEFNLAGAYKVSEQISASFNAGNTVTSTNLTSVFGTENQMDIGGSSAISGTNSKFNGTIKRLTYWPVRLPNPTLQAITQP
jgi:hypothetical protein